MKQHSILPDEANWEQIVADAFSPNAEPHVFSERYQMRKQEMEETLMPKKKIHMKKSMMVAAAAIAAVVIIPTTGYAANRIYTASIQQEGLYQKDVTIALGETVSHQTMQLSVGWMPEGMTGDDVGLKYQGDQNRGVTICFWKMADTETVLKDSVKSAISYEETTCNGNTVLSIHRGTTGQSGVAYDKIVWVAFTDTPYAVQMYGTEAMTDAEMQQIAEHLTLTPSDTETASEWISLEERMESSGSYASHATFDLDNLNLYQIGETIPGNVFDDTVQITLNRATIQSNFDGITTEGCGMPADYSMYQKEDGTIADNVRTWYLAGDGVNTLTTEMEQEIIPQSVLVLNLTYTNTGTKVVEECICPTLFYMQEDGTLLGKRYEETNEVFSTDSFSELNADDGHFSFATDHSFQKNNLTDLQPGESAEVTLAFVVGTEDLKHLYLNIAPIGQELPLEIDQGSPMVDLRSLYTEE